MQDPVDPKRGPYRRTAFAVGFLFLNAIVFLFLGEAIYRPILNAPDMLEIAHPNRGAVVTGVLLEWVATVPMIVLIPILLLPVLRPHGEALAYAYLVLRLMEVTLLSLADALKLALVEVSAGYLEAGGDPSVHRAIADAILAQMAVIDSAGPVYNLLFSAAALVLYAALYKSRLVPHWLGAWGFLAALLLLAGVLLALVVPVSPQAGALIWGPIALNEVALAFWLMIVGFRTPAGADV